MKAVIKDVGYHDAYYFDRHEMIGRECDFITTATWKNDAPYLAGDAKFPEEVQTHDGKRAELHFYKVVIEEV